jgi:hypothetical protein
MRTEKSMTSLKVTTTFGTSFFTGGEPVTDILEGGVLRVQLGGTTCFFSPPFQLVPVTEPADADLIAEEQR